jgi:hypothetical protein
MSKNEQKVALDEIGFNLMSDCDDYWGKLIDRDLWRVPEIDALSGFFESNYEILMHGWLSTNEIENLSERSGRSLRSISSQKH